MKLVRLAFDIARRIPESEFGRVGSGNQFLNHVDSPRWNGVVYAVQVKFLHILVHDAADVDAVGRIPQRMIVSEHADGVCDFVPNLLKGFQFQWTFLAEQWKVMFLGEPEWELLQIVLVNGFS